MNLDILLKAGPNYLVLNNEKSPYNRLIMKKTLLIIRIIFVALCALGSYLVWYSNPDLSPYTVTIFAIGLGLGILTILVDILIKGFSLRGLTTLTFGLAIGAFVAYLIGSSPLFEDADPQTKYLVRLSLFLICMYLATVIALRGKDDFNIMIPYVRFVPNNVESSLVVLDTSALIDGRIVSICQTKFMSAALIVPKFVIEELHKMTDSQDPQKQLKGRKGIEVLNKLKNMPYVDFRIQDLDTQESQHTDSKLIYIAQNLKAKLLTTDYNLAKLAEFHGIDWLNISALSKALNPEICIGQYFDIDVVKPGKESHQGVGYLSDGSMVVVNEAIGYLGQSVTVEVISVLPSVGGKMIFARLQSKPVEAIV